MYPLPCSHCPAFFGPATKMAWDTLQGVHHQKEALSPAALASLYLLPSVGWPGFALQSTSPASCTQCLPSPICCPARASGTSLLSRASYAPPLPRSALPQQLHLPATPASVFRVDPCGPRSPAGAVHHTVRPRSTNFL